MSIMYEVILPTVIDAGEGHTREITAQQPQLNVYSVDIENTLQNYAVQSQLRTDHQSLTQT